MFCVEHFIEFISKLHCAPTICKWLLFWFGNHLHTIREWRNFILIISQLLRCLYYIGMDCFPAIQHGSARFNLNQPAMKTLYAAITLLLFTFITDPRPILDTYPELEEQINRLNGSPKVWAAINAYRNKAWKERDWVKLMDAYHYAVYESTGTDKLVYSDSMIYAATRSKETALIGEAYLAKGIIYYYRKDHMRAFENYTVANRYIATTDDQYLKHKVKYHMALIKSYLGYYHEAIALLKECTAYYEREDPFAYANSLHSLALCYSRTGALKLSVKTNAEAAQVSREAGYDKIMPHIQQLEGVNLYHNADYSRAIKVLEHTMAPIRKEDDFATEAVSYFYIGKSYKSLKMDETALTYFRKVDSIYCKRKYIRPELRENYELLIAYYRDRDTMKKALPYIERLLVIDKEIDNNFRYLSQKIHREYDTRALQAFKDDAERKSVSRNRYHMVAVVFSVALLCFLPYFVYRNLTAQRRYRKKYAELLANGLSTATKKASRKIPKIPVTDTITERILKCLEDFEKEDAFREPELTASALAERFKTNNKYLASVILAHRGKSFTDYINGLRINYILQRLRNESRIRQYNTAGLAQEAGFVSTQHFTGCFKKETGMTPKFFIQETEWELKAKTADGYEKSGD